MPVHPNIKEKCTRADGAKEVLKTWDISYLEKKWARSQALRKYRGAYKEEGFHCVHACKCMCVGAQLNQQNFREDLWACWLKNLFLKIIFIVIVQKVNSYFCGVFLTYHFFFLFFFLEIWGQDSQCRFP